MNNKIKGRRIESDIIANINTYEANKSITMKSYN
jgi:hypothetical protein